MTKNIFNFEGIDEVREQLSAIMVADTQFREKIDAIIEQAMAIIKKEIQSNAQSVLGPDPRDSYKAVVYTVYRKVLGGNVNILNRRTRLGSTSYQRQRTLTTGQRGGNRRQRSARTQQLESYQSYDRAFVLNFANSGAKKGGGNRTLASFKSDEHRGNVQRGSQGGNISKYGKSVNTGNRGSIRATNFFRKGAQTGNTKAIAYIKQTVDQLWSETFR